MLGVGGVEGDRTSFSCKNELLEGKGPSESLRVVSEPGRRWGSCGRETRDRGAGFPLSTPPGLQAPPLPKMCPPHPQPSCPRGAPRTLPAIRGLLLPRLRLETPRPDRPRLPPHPGAGNATAGARGPAQAAPLVAASLPHLNRPRPSPQGPARGRAAATGLHNPAGDWGRGAAGRRRPRSAGGARRPPVGIPSTRLRRAGCPSTPFPLRSSVGRSRWQESASNMADRKRPREEERTFQPRRLWGERARRAGLGRSHGVQCPKGASRDGNDPRDEGSQPPPHRPPREEPPRPQVGLRWRWEDTS